MAILQAVSIFDPLEYLTSAELDRLDTQFDSVLVGTSCLVFWTGIPRKVVQIWAGKNGLKTLTIAMGPLFDGIQSPRSKKSPRAWSRYMKGASVRFAQYACQGRQAVVLTNPPPSIYSLRIGSTFRHLEEPVLKGACGGLSATRIDFVHPTVDGAADFRYEAWPCDNTREWITFFVNTLHRKLDKALNKYALPLCKDPTQDGPVTQGIEQWDLFNNACNGAVGAADPPANRCIGADQQKHRQQNKEGEVISPPKMQKPAQEKRAARREKVQAQLQKQQKLVQEKRAAKQEKVREQEKQAQEKRDAKRQRVREQEKQTQEKKDAKRQQVQEREKQVQEKRDAKQEKVREQEKRAQDKRDAKRQRVREQEKQAQEKKDAKRQKVREQEKRAQDKRDAKRQEVREQEKQAQEKKDAKRQKVREQEKQAQEKRDAKRQKVREQEKQAQEKRDAKRQKVREQERQAQEKRDAK